jgi:DNA polymerase III alpha subunit
VLTQACAKVNPETAAAFFADVLNNGGSAHYGLGAAVEEARRWGVVMLGPCVNRSTDRFAVENDAFESVTPDGKGQQSVGAIRLPLTAIRGIGAEAARHIIAMRTAFGPFTSLLDFRQRIERGLLDRRGLLALIKLGAFDFTALPRAQLAMAEQVYSATADLLLASDRHPAAIAPLEEGLTELVGRAAGALEWPPEVLAADELAYLGFYVLGRVSRVILGLATGMRCGSAPPFGLHRLEAHGSEPGEDSVPVNVVTAFPVTRSIDAVLVPLPLAPLYRPVPPVTT